MDGCRDRLGSGSRFHGDGKFADHVAGMAGHDRGTEDRIGPLFGVNPRKPFVFPVQNRSINLVQFVGIGFDFDPFSPLPLSHTFRHGRFPVR